MSWLPVLFACLMGSCEFFVGEIEWSLADCEQIINVATKELEESGAVASGVCVEIRIT